MRRPSLDHGRRDAAEGDVPSNAQFGDLVQLLLAEAVLQQVSIVDRYLEVIHLAKDLELEYKRRR